MKVQVKDNSDLYRDSESNAIINTNRAGARLAREAKKRIQQERERLDKLENDVSEIKSMLREILCR
jgi:predicted transcriptional regulator